MKFKDKYPNQKKNEPEVEGMIRNGYFYDCETCKKPTDWYDLNLELRFCSEECKTKYVVVDKKEAV